MGLVAYFVVESSGSKRDLSCSLGLVAYLRPKSVSAIRKIMIRKYTVDLAQNHKKPQRVASGNTFLMRALKPFVLSSKQLGKWKLQ